MSDLETLRALIGRATEDPFHLEGEDFGLGNDDRDFIIQAMRLARVVADPKTVEKLGRIIDPGAFVFGEDARRRHPHALATAQAVLEALVEWSAG